MVFSPLGNYDHAVLLVSIDFPTNSKQDVLFHRIAYGCSCAYWDGLCNHLRDVPWEHIFKLNAPVAATEFCKWVPVGIDAYIPIISIRSKPHRSSWFSAACAAAIVVQLVLLSDRLVIVAKGFFKLPNLHMLIKQRVYHFPETWLSGLSVNC